MRSVLQLAAQSDRAWSTAPIDRDLYEQSVSFEANCASQRRCDSTALMPRTRCRKQHFALGGGHHATLWIDIAPVSSVAYYNTPIP
jgi:hypothetical protein